MHNIQNKLGVKNMTDLTIKDIKRIYNTKALTDEKIYVYKKHESELIDSEKFMYIHESISLSIIMNCRTPTAIEFRTKLGFNQHNLIMTEK